ncbi:hypothetical protein [Actinorhabdospora filicis]|uniref:hypothetical protein n=1 Tax=Actinorhabdospora filicis TaxID=1785913 RepID=UPI0025575431|nr:hypothetical protein [Actinorhabdospora filicis]
MSDLAHADRLAAAAIILLRRGEAGDERTRVLDATLTELRELLARDLRPVRRWLLDTGPRVVLAFLGLAAGTACHLLDARFWGIAAVLPLTLAAVFLRSRPPSPSPEPGGEAEGDVAAIVREIGVALATHGAQGSHGGRLAHTAACLARAWDVLNLGAIPPYTPGAGYQRFGRVPFLERHDASPAMRAMRATGLRWNVAATAHRMVHQYWYHSLYHPAGRRILARADHVLRYTWRAPGGLPARLVVTLPPLLVAAFLGGLLGLAAAVVCLGAIELTRLDPCHEYPPSSYAAFDVRADDAHTRWLFSVSGDPVLRELMR